MPLPFKEHTLTCLNFPQGQFPKSTYRAKGLSPLPGLKTHEKYWFLALKTLPILGLDLKSHKTPPWKSPPGKTLPTKNPHIKPASCSVLGCFSPEQRQPPSCVFPNKSLEWFAVWCDFVYSLTSSSRIPFSLELKHLQ